MEIEKLNILRESCSLAHIACLVQQPPIKFDRDLNKYLFKKGAFGSPARVGSILSAVDQTIFM